MYGISDVYKREGVVALGCGRGNQGKDWMACGARGPDGQQVIISLPVVFSALAKATSGVDAVGESGGGGSGDRGRSMID